MELEILGMPIEDAFSICMFTVYKTGRSNQKSKVCC